MINFPVAPRHRKRLLIHMRLTEHAGDSDIQRQADDRLGLGEIRPRLAKIGKGFGHHGMDQAGAVHQRAVAIEKNQLHRFQSSLSPSATSRPSRFQVCTICGGRGALTRSRPPEGCGMSI
ncbi:hypothetical protein D3C80_561480 [compost metagenome]